MHGTRAVQKMINLLPTRRQASIFQKCLNNLAPEDNQVSQQPSNYLVRC